MNKRSFDDYVKDFTKKVQLQPLKRVIETTYQNGTQISRLPDNEEIMNKINEIIKYINDTQ